ncbi:MAG: UDP-N-acetylmuramate dehydrogenase [Ignavibacteriaceae bacterium]|nr:UDP-N-acetylmuramate dehydrogenase [Ignavibacteriaceae bacterium]
MDIKENYSLKRHNTFGMNVSCRFFAQTHNDEEILQLLSTKRFEKFKKLVIGIGSNILFTKDFDGLVITQMQNKIYISDTTSEYTFITAEAGAIWNDVVNFCVQRNLGGIENLALIPGKVGAAPIQNIGAYGQELKDVFYSLNGILVDDLKLMQLNKSDCEFGYRASVFKNKFKNRFIITDITLKLNNMPTPNLDYGILAEKLSVFDPAELTIKHVSDAVCEIRKSKLPDPQILGNAGSFFKNPEITEAHFTKLNKLNPNLRGFKISENKYKISAAWLIEKIGFKGKKIGNVGVHSEQPLVLVNFGGAMPNELIELKEKIKREVNIKFDILLEEEVNLI